MVSFTDMTVAEIGAWLKAKQGKISAQDLALLRQDRRKGVRRLAARYELQKAREQAERQRLARMWRLEERAWAEGFKLVVGVDEAGCGPLAGPVVAAAVIFPPSRPTIWGLNDSKQLSAEKRQELYQRIIDTAVAALAPDLALVDGNQARLPTLSFPCKAIQDGDSHSCSIAAASIVAKVTRDRLMAELDRVYPGYGFAQHKGYPSRQHYAALRQLGPSPIHRQSFLRKFFEEGSHEH